MQQFYKDFGFIIGFMVIVLVWDLAFKEKGTFYMLMVVLLGMLVLNYKNMTAFFNDTFIYKEDSNNGNLN